MSVDQWHQPAEMLTLAMGIQSGLIRPLFDKDEMAGVLVVHV